MVKVRADDRICAPFEATCNELRETPPTFSGYFFEGDNWDDIVRVGSDKTDERLETLVLGVRRQVHLLQHREGPYLRGAFSDSLPIH